jgi:hypothetical protein
MTGWKRRLAALEAALAAAQQADEPDPWACARWDSYFNALEATQDGRSSQPEMPPAPPGHELAAWRSRMVESFLINAWVCSGQIDAWVRSGIPRMEYPAWASDEDRQRFEAFMQDVRLADELLQGHSHRGHDTG